MPTRCLSATLLLLSLLLGACALLNPPAEQQQKALDDFIYALRWQRYADAAAFFVADHRQAFLEQMTSLKDLNITEVRTVRRDLSEAGRRAETRLEIDYYLLPSITLKTLSIDQTWRWFEGSADSPQGFQIITPFPKFP
jgi:hypothetical protein